MLRDKGEKEQNVQVEEKNTFELGQITESFLMTANLPRLRANVFNCILKDVYYNTEGHEEKDIEEFQILNQFLNSID